jgi:enediyne biosynthesis protein E4
MRTLAALFLLPVLPVLPLPGGQQPDPQTVQASPTFPVFVCEPDMPYCNRAAEADLMVVQRYGRGAAFVDINGDGWDDLFLADCDNRWDPEGYGVSAFFVNRHDGTFIYVPAPQLGIAEADLQYTWSGSFADYDNDGDPDLLLANGGYSGSGHLALYENRIPEGGVFVPRTEESGIGGADDTPSGWWGSSWADYDNDGWLDVVVTRTSGRPLLFHNDADGSFTEVGPGLGVTLEMDDGKNPVWLDYDDDLDPDLYLAGIWQHAFYRNDEGHFTDITNEIFSEPFPGPPAVDDAPVVFAAAAADFDQDGFDDLYLGRFDLQDVVLVNDGNGRFVEHSTDWGLVTTNVGWPDFTQPYENTMGLGVGDLFDDGYPDVLIGTGNPSRAAQDMVFCNTADDFLRRCTGEITRAGVEGVWRTRSHGTVFSDFDRDGDTDFAVNLGGHPGFDAEQGERISPEWPALFVNQGASTENTASLTLVGTRSNRDALGARIRVLGEDSPRYDVIRSMQGFQSQNSRRRILSLGTATTARVEIRWPSGEIQVLTLEAGEDRTVVEAGQ